MKQIKRRYQRQIREGEYISYHGQTHNPDITRKPRIYIGGGVPLSSVCDGHVLIVEPELSVSKAKEQLKRALEEWKLEG